MQDQQKRKIPQRRCVGCHESKAKNELIRVVRAPDGSVSLDFTGKKSGRGAYLCKQMGCLKKAMKAKRLDSQLECTIPEEVYLLLQQQLEQGEA